MPALVGGVVLMLDGFGLMPARIMEIGLGLIAATAIASFGRGVGVGLFAPDEPGRRLLADVGRHRAADDAASDLGRARSRRRRLHQCRAARAGGACLAHGRDQHHSRGRDRGLALSFPVPRSAAMSPKPTTSAARNGCAARAGCWSPGSWFRSSPALSGSRAFLAGRFLVALVVIGALYICLVFTDSLFTEILTANTPRGRKVAGFFGLKPRSIELIGTLLSAVIRLLLILVVLLPLLGPWGIFAADFFGVRARRGVRFPHRRCHDFDHQHSERRGASVHRHPCDARRADAGCRRISCRAPGSIPACRIRSSTIFGYACIVAVIALDARRRSGSTCRRSRSSPARSPSASASACRRWCRISSPD